MLAKLRFWLVFLEAYISENPPAIRKQNSIYSRLISRLSTQQEKSYPYLEANQILYSWECNWDALTRSDYQILIY